MGTCGFEPEITIDSDEADQNPKDFHQKGGKIEINEQREHDQTRADRIQQGERKEILLFMLVPFVLLSFFCDLLLPHRQRAASGLLFFQAQSPISLHEGVDVTRSFVDDRGLAVAQVSLDRIIV